MFFYFRLVNGTFLQFAGGDIRQCLTWFAVNLSTHIHTH